MLAKPNRITRGSDYKAIVRRGARCAGTHTVTYVGGADATAPARFGFIVSRQVGSAVTRNLVRRRLKAICAEAVDTVRPGADVVIRALPSSAVVDFGVLREEVVRCLMRKAA